MCKWLITILGVCFNHNCICFANKCPYYDKFNKCKHFQENQEVE